MVQIGQQIEMVNVYGRSEIGEEWGISVQSEEEVYSEKSMSILSSIEEVVMSKAEGLFQHLSGRPYQVQIGDVVSDGVPCLSGVP